MSKKVFVLSAVLFTCCFYYCFSNEAIVIAPVVSYDNNGEKVIKEKNANILIRDDLSHYSFDNLIKFESLSESKHGIVNSIMDAEKICAAYDYGYLIYGYIKQNDKSWFMELKMYNHMTKKIEKDFFASDDIDNYERMLSVISEHIRDYYTDLLGLDSNKSIYTKYRNVEFDLPFGVGFWTPLDKDWMDVLMGICYVKSGVELFPKLKLPQSGIMKFDLSIRCDLGYGYGTNKNNSYPINYNVVSAGLPILCHYYINKKNGIYIGFGPLYEFDIMQVEQKYKKAETLHQNQFGFENILGYEYFIGKKFKLKFETEGDFYVTSDSTFVLKSGLGFVYRFYK